MSHSNISLAYEKPKEITFSIPRSKKNTDALWLNDIYTEAFARMGIKFFLEEYPGNRSNLLVREGIVDGELERVYSYLDFNEDLVRVKENNRIVSFCAYSADEHLKLDGWDSLKNKDFKIGYRLGVKLPEKILPLIIDKKKIIVSRSFDIAVTKLKYKRIDIYIELESHVNVQLKNRVFDELNIKMYNVGIMDNLTSHAYLNSKHKTLEPELSRVLSEMKKEGLFREYMIKYDADFKW